MHGPRVACTNATDIYGTWVVGARHGERSDLAPSMARLSGRTAIFSDERYRRAAMSNLIMRHEARPLADHRTIAILDEGGALPLPTSADWLELADNSITLMTLA